MKSAEAFYTRYWDNVPFAKTDDFSISAVMTMDSEFLFWINFFGRYHAYIFNMLKPEVIAINKWFEPKYIPLTINDIELIMDGLINKEFWNKCIEQFEWWIDSDNNPTEDNGSRMYPLDSLDKIPNTPPDYRLIWKNGYTGKEDDDFVSYDYG